jgi:hypothetical protein
LLPSGDPPGANTFVAVPVIFCAAVDISGTTTDSVTMVALNDNNDAAFGFGTGGNSDLHAFAFDQYHTFTWHNGALGSETIIDCDDVVNEGYDSTSDVAYTDWLLRWPVVLFANGDAFGNEQYVTYTTAWGESAAVYQDIFSSTGGQVTSQVPPPYNPPDNYAGGYDLTAMSSNGIQIGGASLQSGGILHYSGFMLKSGAMILFALRHFKWV